MKEKLKSYNRRLNVLLNEEDWIKINKESYRYEMTLSEYVRFILDNREIIKQAKKKES